MKERPSSTPKTSRDGSVNINEMIKELLKNEAPPFNEGTGLIGIRPKQQRVIVNAEEAALAKKTELEDKIALVQKIVTTLEGMLDNDLLTKNEISGIRAELFFKKINLNALSNQLSMLTKKLEP